ncbi:hypothetical protein HDU93_005023 [Gonapodya sp. JEL0774]|nr:hypothetical protein HDU93_005023 [Gonapodya sp. JEL0774]
MSYFVVVGTRDNPLYEAEFGSPRSDLKREEHKHLNQFIVHAALDMVDEAMWATKDMYLKTVDKFNDFFVSAYVTPSGTRFMLLHDAPNPDGIRNFFSETHELFLKTLLNPFYEINAPITSTTFDTKVKAIGRKYLG